MSQRIKSIRSVLKQKLKEEGSVHNWDHITNQIGMFAYTGLSADQVTRMKKEYSLYTTLCGRISMAGINNNNVEYIAKAIHDVSK